MRSTNAIVAINSGPNVHKLDITKYSVTRDRFEVVFRLTEKIRKFESRT